MAVPPWAVEAYPFVMAALLTGYGLLLGHRPSLAMVVLVLASWFVVAGWRGYRGLRQVVVGLDYLVLSLTLFAVAVLVSLNKAVAVAPLVGWRRTGRHGRMSRKEAIMIELTEEQGQELSAPDPVAIDPLTKQEYVLVRREYYERLKRLDESVLTTGDLVDDIMAEDDANDPLLESYQHYGKKA